MTHPNPTHFINEVALKLIELSKGDPLVLAQSTVIVPSARFVTALHHALINNSPNQSILAPHIYSVMDIPRDCRKEVTWPQFLLIVQPLLHLSKFDRLNLSQDYQKLYVFYNFLNQLILNDIDLKKQIVDVPLNCLNVWEIYGQTILSLIDCIESELSKKGYVMPARNVVDAWHKLSEHTQATAQKIFLVGLNHPYIALAPILDQLKKLNSVLTVQAASMTQNLQQICTHHAAPFDMIEFDNIMQEAMGIACIIRHQMEQGFKNIAIVTQDQELQQSIKGALSQWHITVDDPHGQAWQATLLGQWIQILGDVTMNNHDHMAALVKHPYCTYKLPQDLKSELADDLKHYQNELKQSSPHKTSSTIFYHLDTAVFNHHLAQLTMLIDQSYEAWSQLKLTDHAPLTTWLSAHLDLIKILTNENAFKWDQDQTRLWHQTLERINQVINYSSNNNAVGYHQYRQILAGLFTDLSLTQSVTASQIKFVDFNDSFILDHDSVICCGLSENIFPASPLVSYGLPLNWLEAIFTKRIQDNYSTFNHLVSQSQIIFTRAQTRFGVAQLPSPWWQELDVYLSQLNKKSMALSQRCHTWLEQLQTPPVSQHSVPLMWTLPVAYKPMSLTLRDIENLIQHPYRFFMQHVLQLSPLEDQQDPYTPLHYGMLVHKLMDQAKSWEDFRAQCEQRMKDIDFPLAWRIKLNHINTWLKDQNIVQWQVGQRLAKQFPLQSTYKDLIIKGQVDQMLFDAAHVTLIDFKTGTVPKVQHIENGESLQFPILNYCAKQIGYDVNQATYYDFRNQTTTVISGKQLDAAWQHVHPILDGYLMPQFKLISTAQAGGQDDWLERRQEWEHR